MSNKPYQIPNPASEPAAEASSPDSWNPNVPFVGTQEEWWEHFHRIEEGAFTPVSELHQRVSQWLDNQVLFTGTHEEWWEHFHQIEYGQCTPVAVANKEFEAWKKEYLANRMK
ncbi:MAG: hypothetical protein LBQ65_04420 [Tannerellaceae bacterium]|jgi:hypothetical protein|nr:hypothetical protein [Tannerellaceae bacterium]